MLKLVWAGIAVAFIASMFFVLKWGIRPEPVSLIGASRSPNSQSPGATVFDQLSQVVRAHRVLVWGGIPNSNASQQVVQGFINRAAHFGIFYNQILAQNGQYPQIASTKSIRFNANGDEVAKLISGLKMNQKLLVLTVNVYSSHLLANNPISRLEKKLGRRVLAITEAPLAIQASELESLHPACGGLQPQIAGTRKLGCMMAARSKKVFSKGLPSNQMTATLDMVGSGDYLMLVHSPQKSP